MKYERLFKKNMKYERLYLLEHFWLMASLNIIPTRRITTSRISIINIKYEQVPDVDLKVLTLKCRFQIFNTSWKRKCFFTACLNGVSHKLEQQDTYHMHSSQTKFKDHKADKWVKSHENTLFRNFYSRNILQGWLWISVRWWFYYSVHL